LASLRRSVDSSIHENEVISLLEEIVRVPSYIGVKDGERKVAQILASYFESNGIESNIEAVGAGVNILASLGAGIEGAPSMMLNGHLDTVPTGNMSIPPFEAMVREGILYGRGACDMKGGLASMASALVALKRSQLNIEGTLLFAGVSGEESGSPGTRRIVQKGPRTDCAIVGEPTHLKIGGASQGMVYARIVVKGKAAHGSAPWKGINAIEKATKIVACMNKSLPRVLKSKRHMLLGSPSYNLGVMRAGTQPNIVPDQCIIMPAMDTPIDATFVKCLSRAAEEVRGKSELVGLSGSTDGNLLSEGGVPSVVFGPGDLEKAHSADECVDLEEVIDAAEIYARTALRYLS
jgi:acetylornithine deacetylase/succinyl-diaminopimelate desuccinylase-like protein